MVERKKEEGWVRGCWYTLLSLPLRFSDQRESVSIDVG